MRWHDYDANNITLEKVTIMKQCKGIIVTLLFS